MWLTDNLEKEWNLSMLIDATEKKYWRQIHRVKGLVVLLSTYYIPVVLPVYIRLENISDFGAEIT